MGVIYSSFELIHNALYEEISETKTDGTIVTKRMHPAVSALTVAGAVSIILVYIDQGTGTISKIFNRNK
jgi:hypothetical protein